MVLLPEDLLNLLLQVFMHNILELKMLFVLMFLKVKL